MVLFAIFFLNKANANFSERTPFGDPDLQGLWTNRSITQLERHSFEPKLVLTPQEAEKIEYDIKHNMNTPDNFTVRVGNSSVPVMVAYNSFWTDTFTHFAVVNGEIRSSWIVDPPSGKVPYTEQAISMLKKRILERYENFDNPESRWPDERCLIGFGSTGGPPMLSVYYNNFYQIVQSPGFVTIIVEMNHDARIIRLNSEHLPKNFHPWLGDSIGHWEKNTLVVETTNINPEQSFSMSPHQKLYLSPNSKVIEWFTRVAKDEILYKFQVEEPNSYKQIWRGEMTMNATEGPMYEFACHEGNRSFAITLAGARYQEKLTKTKKHKEGTP